MAEKEKKESLRQRFDLTKLNTLSVVSLATSVTGFGALAGIITGHISLAQIKDSKENGRPLAIAGLVVGYAFIALFVAGAIVKAFVGPRYGLEFGDRMGGGLMGPDGMGQHGGQFDMNGQMGDMRNDMHGGDMNGQMGGDLGGGPRDGQGMQGDPNGQGGWMMDPNAPTPTPTTGTN